MAMITISREFGSGGDEIARRVCEALGYRYFDKTLIAEVARERGSLETEAIDSSEDGYRLRGFADSLFRRSAATPTTSVAGDRRDEGSRTRAVDEETAAASVASTIRTLWARGQVVVVGRGGQAILRGSPGVLHVRIVASLDDRVRRVMATDGLSQKSAASLVAERDRATAEYLRRFRDVDWTDPSLYHLTLNTSLLDRETAVELIVTASRRLPVRPPA